jgi:hypothetical protein
MSSLAELNILDSSEKLALKISQAQLNLLTSNLPIYLTKLLAKKMASDDGNMQIKQTIDLSMLDDGTLDFECAVQVDIKESLKDSTDVIHFDAVHEELPGLSEKRK